METLDNLKDRMPDGCYLDFCSALKENHDDMEEWDEIVDMRETEAWTGKFIWENITGNRDVLLPHIISDLERMIPDSNVKVCCPSLCLRYSAKAVAPSSESCRAPPASAAWGSESSAKEFTGSSLRVLREFSVSSPKITEFKLSSAHVNCCCC